MRQTLKWMELRQRSNLDSSKVPRHHQHAHALGGELKDEDFIFESPHSVGCVIQEWLKAHQGSVTFKGSKLVTQPNLVSFGEFQMGVTAQNKTPVSFWV